MGTVHKHLMGILMFLVGAGGLTAQPEFQFTIQTWAHSTVDRRTGSTNAQLGFGVRRARLRGRMTQGRASAFIQYEALSSKLLNARIDYAFGDNFTLRMGRIIGPGSQAGVRTPHTAIDFAERSIVGRYWSSAVKRPDGRSFGLVALGRTNLLRYEIMASNGDSELNLRPYNTDFSSSTTGAGIMPQIDLMLIIDQWSAVEAGLHIGLPNQNRVNVGSLTGYAYYRPQVYQAGAVRGKLDLAMVLDRTGPAESTLAGVGFSGFYKINDNMEIGAGYAFWDPDLAADGDAVGNITAVVTYSPNPQRWQDTLFKLAVTYKTTEASGAAPDPLLIHLVWQIYLH
ncbi:MAG: hypothetical protein IIA60_02215 [Candidatus Marinimicrobia bacterium]|nr:hypothetical protein [Candidatus Neomarinimicrobiota bacterium]